MITKLVTHYEYLFRNEARYEARNAPVYVSQELLLWRQSERTSARGSGGSSGGAAASSGEDAATGGSV